MKILVVCLGNICRSPAAEAIFDDYIEQYNLHEKLQVDSAGTSGYHAGELPDSRMRSELQTHGHKPCKSRSRQFQQKDFDQFDTILVMDKSNLRNVLSLAENDLHRQKIEMMADYADESLGWDFIPDPYYGGQEGFTEVISLLENSIHNFLKSRNLILS